MVKVYSTPKLSKVYPYKETHWVYFFKIRKKPLGKISAPAKILDNKFWEAWKIFSLRSPEY